MPEWRSTRLSLPLNFSRKFRDQALRGMKVSSILTLNLRIISYQNPQRSPPPLPTTQHNPSRSTNPNGWLSFGVAWKSAVLIQFLQSMLQLFKPKDYRKLTAIFSDYNFNTDDFLSFQIDELACKLKAHESAFPHLIQILRETKLTPLKSLKILMLCYKLMHLLKVKHQHQSLLQFIHELQVRARALMRAKKGLRLSDSLDSLHTSKQMMSGDDQVVMDFSSILIAKIVTPLIHFQQKLLISYQSLFNRSKYELSSEEEVWSWLNLLRKVVEIGPDIESLGRYYFKESASAVLCMMKIINLDIQFLYKRIYEYFHRKMVQFQLAMEENKDMKKLGPEQRVQEFLMMLEELEVINQKLRVIYNGRYFVFIFTKNNVYAPVLFTGEEHIELLYKIKEFRKQRKNRQPQHQHKRKRGFWLGEIIEQV